MFWGFVYSGCFLGEYSEKARELSILIMTRLFLSDPFRVCLLLESIYLLQ